MNLWTLFMAGMGSASLLFIQQSDFQAPDPTDKPNIFFLSEKIDSYRARISLVNPFEDKIIGYRISTNQPALVKITNSKLMSHGYLVPKEQRSISMKYNGENMADSTSVMLEWVVLDPKSLNPINSDPAALKSLFLKFGRVTTVFKCRKTAIRVPEIETDLRDQKIVRVPSSRSANISSISSLTDLFLIFVMFLMANLTVSLVRNFFYQ